MTAHTTTRPTQTSHRPPAPRQRDVPRRALIGRLSYCAWLLAWLSDGACPRKWASESAASSSPRSRRALRTITPPFAPAFALARGRRTNRRRDVLDADHSGVKRPPSPVDAPAGAKAESFSVAKSVVTSLSSHSYGPDIRCDCWSMRPEAIGPTIADLGRAGRPAGSATAVDTAGLPGAGKPPRVAKALRAARATGSSSV